MEIRISAMEKTKNSYGEMDGKMGGVSPAGNLLNRGNYMAGNFLVCFVMCNKCTYSFSFSIPDFQIEKS